jgi:hypothetical protein
VDYRRELKNNQPARDGHQPNQQQRDETMKTATQRKADATIVANKLEEAFALAKELGVVVLAANEMAVSYWKTDGAAIDDDEETITIWSERWERPVEPTFLATIDELDWEMGSREYETESNAKQADVNGGWDATREWQEGNITMREWRSDRNHLSISAIGPDEEATKKAAQTEFDNIMNKQMDNQINK